MTDRIIKWINSDRLMHIWELMPGELLQLCDGKIQAYERYNLYTVPGDVDRWEYTEYDYREWAPSMDDQLQYAWYNLD